MRKHNSMNDTPEAGSGPLSGLRILDLTQFLAGPYATMIFADLGAEVIKLEAPVGDWSRVLPPNFVGEDSCYYLSINRNKQSIVVDMKNDEGLEIVQRLADESDILVENFRPGVLDRLGLTYEGLSKRNPGLIWASISGFGQTGKDRDRPAYDMIVQAISGGMGMTGEPGRSAVRSGIPLGDLSAGMYAVIGASQPWKNGGRPARGSTSTFRCSTARCRCCAIRPLITCIRVTIRAVRVGGMTPFRRTAVSIAPMAARWSLLQIPNACGRHFVMCWLFPN